MVLFGGPLLKPLDSSTPRRKPPSPHLRNYSGRQRCRDSVGRCCGIGDHRPRRENSHSNPHRIAQGEEVARSQGGYWCIGKHWPRGNRRRFQPSPNCSRTKNNLVRKAAAEALGNIGSRAKPPSPRWSSCSRTNDAAFRLAAVRALGTGSDAKTAIPILTELLKDEDEFIRRAADEAFGQAGPPPVPALIALLKDEKQGHSTGRCSAFAECQPRGQNRHPSPHRLAQG